MKKIIMFLVLGFTGYCTMAQVERKAIRDSAATANTFSSGKALKKAEKRKMLRELNLTKEQRGKLKEIKQGNQAEKQAVINDASLTADQKKDKLRNIKKAGAVNLQSVLDDEQKAKMKAMRKGKQSANKKNKAQEEE